MHTPSAGQGKAVVAPIAKAPSVHDRIGHADDGDTRYIVGGWKYTPRRGGRFDPDHDRGESPEPPGTLVFSREIRTASFPPRFRQPNTLIK